jgi:hypothetical protein
MLQTCYVESYPFNGMTNGFVFVFSSLFFPFLSQTSEKAPIPLPDWEIFITQIAQLMIAEQSPKQLLAIRGKFYELLVHCIPAETIIKVCCCGRVGYILSLIF